MSKNKLKGAEIKIKPTDNGDFSAQIILEMTNGKPTSLLTPMTFKTVEEAAEEALQALKAIAPTVAQKAEDLVADKPKGKGGRTHVEFMGEVAQLGCECHKGQWAVGVFLFHPTNGKREFLDWVMKDSEQHATETMEETVMELAKKFLAGVGLKVEDAAEIVIKRGEDARNHEALATAKIDNTVH